MGRSKHKAVAQDIEMIELYIEEISGKKPKKLKYENKDIEAFLVGEDQLITFTVSELLDSCHAKNNAINLIKQKLEN